jgi:hypothetical protein
LFAPRHGSPLADNAGVDGRQNLNMLLAVHQLFAALTDIRATDVKNPRRLIAD